MKDVKILDANGALTRTMRWAGGPIFVNTNTLVRIT